MKKEYSKPELNIAEYIIETNITADPSYNFTNGFADTDKEVEWF